MSNFIETKLIYEKIEGASTKKVTEAFLVDALSFTEAETRITKERAPYIRGEFKVDAVKRTKISEIFHAEGDRYYLVKWQTTTIDEKSVAMGKIAAEKKTTVLTLVQAEDLLTAVERFISGMRGTLGDYEIIQVGETPYLDIYEAKQ